MSSFDIELIDNNWSGSISNVRLFIISLVLALPVWAAVYLAISANWLTLELLVETPVWFWVVVILPIAEEFAFRGFLMGLLGKFLSNSSFGFITINNFLTSICFSMAHVVTRSLALGVLVYIPSLWLGWIREKSSSILLCAAIHVMWNLGFFAAASLAYLSF